MCLFVCLSTNVSQKPHDQISWNFSHMLRVTVAFHWRQYDTLFTSGFVNDAMFSYNGVGQNQRRYVCFVEFARWRHQSNVRWCSSVECARLQHRRREYCSWLVKLKLFQSYCICFYNRPTALWNSHNKVTLDRFVPCYNKSVKRFFGFPKYSSYSFVAAWLTNL